MSWDEEGGEGLDEEDYGEEVCFEAGACVGYGDVEGGEGAICSSVFRISVCNLYIVVMGGMIW